MNNKNYLCDNCVNAVWEDGIIVDCKKEPIFDPGVQADHICCNGKYEDKRKDSL